MQWKKISVEDFSIRSVKHLITSIKKNIAHRDVKLDKIFFKDNTNIIKIIDFGFEAFCQKD